jgi:hypothetical protein
LPIPLGTGENFQKLAIKTQLLIFLILKFYFLLHKIPKTRIKESKIHNFVNKNLSETKKNMLQ